MGRTCNNYFWDFLSFSLFFDHLMQFFKHFCGKICQSNCQRLFLPLNFGVVMCEYNLISYFIPFALVMAKMIFKKIWFYQFLIVYSYCSLEVPKHSSLIDSCIQLVNAYRITILINNNTCYGITLSLFSCCKQDSFCAWVKERRYTAGCAQVHTKSLGNTFTIWVLVFSYSLCNLVWHFLK